ncbi:MAG: 4'-phosphopantetheinyl transferase superfamily protein [Pseudomonadota bacterium]
MERLRPSGSYTGMAGAICPLDDYSEQLDVEQMAILGEARDVRKVAFSIGRYCALLAQEQLNLAPSIIGQNARAPLWPDNLSGSISHSKQLAVSIVSREPCGVGVDIETLGRISDKLLPTLFTSRELRKLETAPDYATTLAFSAKEAGYKAIAPWVGEYIGFQEAEIIPDYAAGTFRIHYLGKSAPEGEAYVEPRSGPSNRALDSGLGYFAQDGNHVLTMFVIPSQAIARNPSSSGRNND